MGLFGCPRALRALVLACCTVWLAPAAGLAADPAIPVEPTPPREQSVEPFGLPVSVLVEGRLREKWLGIERQLDDELLVLARCEEDRATCGSAAALRFLAIIDNGKSRDG